MGTAKVKKVREDRVRSHCYEWEHDITLFLRAHTSASSPYFYTTQKEFCSELGIPRSTLNKLLSNTIRIDRHVIGVGNQKQTGLALVEFLRKR